YITLTEMVIHAGEQSKNKTLIITSAVPGEGKTHVAVNLALSLASAGKKTLLLDFDCYRDDLRTLMELKPAKFLMDILKGDIPYQQEVLEDPVTGLHLILSEQGKVFNINILNSPKLKEVFAEVENEYDYIIVDTPPVLIQSETISLLKHIDSVLLVVRQETATIKDLENARDKILGVGAKIIGCVLNDIRHLIGTEYKYKYGYYGKYYYSDRAGQNKKFFW
ncbi:MAG: CpsD/CapB family tyrosine-protein kinase, partial [Desulfitobacteriaceae bacterium]|nr:CpsD/CapB family tyrosine-protein kinase [Desulfitobacteriaceae bacterium]